MQLLSKQLVVWCFCTIFAEEKYDFFLYLIILSVPLRQILRSIESVRILLTTKLNN